MSSNISAIGISLRFDLCNQKPDEMGNCDGLVARMSQRKAERDHLA